VDPLANKYPMLTPYQFASNRPIDGIDLDGLEWSKAKNGNMVFKAVIVNDSRERKNLYSVRYEMEKQYKAMFGKGYEIQVRVIYDDSKLQVAKDEALVKITNPEEFDKLTTGGDAPLGGRVIRISSNKIDYNGRAFVGTDENGIIYENSIYAEEIGHTGRLEHPFELIEKRGNELQMQGVNLGNFMSYPQKDIKNYPPQNGNVISAEDAIDLQIEWSRNPSPASEGQKAAVKQNYEKGTLNQGEIK